MTEHGTITSYRNGCRCDACRALLNPMNLADIVREGFYDHRANYWTYETDEAEEALRELVALAKAGVR